MLFLLHFVNYPANGIAQNKYALMLNKKLKKKFNSFQENVYISMNIGAVILQMNRNNWKKILNHMISVTTNLKQNVLRGDSKPVASLSICCWPSIPLRDKVFRWSTGGLVYYQLITSKSISSYTFFYNLEIREMKKKNQIIKKII